jgi:hypothetical protein
MNKATMDKPGPLSTKLLVTFLGATLNDVFKRQGFASRELVTRWAEIVGTRVAAHAEPIKIQWPRPVGDEPPEPATLVLRVEGPVALEIQHSSDVILARVNQFFGWQAVGRLALRQAPLRRPEPPRRRTGPDAATVANAAATLGAVDDPDLRTALARLKASITHS